MITKEEIEEAFKPYYEATILDETINVNLIYDTQIMLRDARLYNDGDIESFIRIYYKDGEQTAADLGRLTSLMKPAIDRYLDLLKEDQFEFRKTIRNFNKWYAYIIQITRMYDKELHKEYVFTTYLQKLLPRLLPRPEIISLDLDDKLRLEFYKLEQSFKGDISLHPTVEETMVSYGDLSDTSESIEDEEDYLDQIIERINERYQGDIGDQDWVVIESISREITKGNRRESLATYAKMNGSEVFTNSIFPKDFKDIVFSLY